jgi:hypothetical protein
MQRVHWHSAEWPWGPKLQRAGGTAHMKILAPPWKSWHHPLPLPQISDASSQSGTHFNRDDCAFGSCPNSTFFQGGRQRNISVMWNTYQMFSDSGMRRPWAVTILSMNMSSPSTVEINLVRDFAALPSYSYSYFYSYPFFILPLTPRRRHPSPKDRHIRLDMPKKASPFPKESRHESVGIYQHPYVNHLC